MSMRKIINNAPNAPAAIGPYSQAVGVGNLVFLSGQIGMDQSGDLVSADFSEQAEQVFKNLKAVCEHAGGSINDLVKLNVFLTDLNNFAKFNEIATKYLQEPYPARALIGVASLPKDAIVEAEAVLLVK